MIAMDTTLLLGVGGKTATKLQKAFYLIVRADVWGAGNKTYGCAVLSAQSSLHPCGIAISVKVLQFSIQVFVCSRNSSLLAKLFEGCLGWFLQRPEVFWTQFLT